MTGNGFREVVHPSLWLALEGFGRAGIRVDLRSWAGDRVVVSDLAVGVEAGVGLTRLRATPGSPSGSVSAEGVGLGVDAIGVELAVFESGEVLAAVERLLPPLPVAVPPSEGVTPGGKDTTVTTYQLTRDIP